MPEFEIKLKESVIFINECEKEYFGIFVIFSNAKLTTCKYQISHFCTVLVLLTKNMINSKK